MHLLTLNQMAEGLRDKQFSSVELAKHFLARIEALDKRYNSFITVTAELALEQAKAADARRAKGESGPLLGVPIAHKDIFCTNGVRTSCGSRMLDNFIAPYNATVVDKLACAGVVMLGKTNMDEFAMGSSNENSWYGAAHNPWDRTRVPGGSSGGSAAAVAARLAPVATGTDTGGSIRQPAALTGTVGLKPTYGRVSRFGMIAFASSLDQGGIIAQDALDAALVLKAMAGFDPHDSTSVDRPVDDYPNALSPCLNGLKVGMPKEFFDQQLNPELSNSIDQALDELRKAGAELVEISLPNSALGIAAYYVIAPAECSSNLSRYDGVRFGHRAQHCEDLQDLYRKSRSEGFGAEVKRRIMIGTYALSAGYYDAYYEKAQRIRRLIRDDYIQAFKDVDILIGPTTPDVAFPLGAKSDPVSMYLCDVFTIGANLAGLPGISIPIRPANGLPAGIQLIGDYFREDLLLAAAHQFQQLTDWHTRLAPGVA